MIRDLLWAAEELARRWLNQRALDRLIMSALLADLGREVGTPESCNSEGAEDKSK